MANSKAIPLKDAAARCGVGRKTMKRWIRKLGYTMPRLGRGRYVLLVPEWMVERLVEKHSPQIPRN